MIDRIGGLMSLLEGHGDVTMTRAAGDLVPDAERYARVLAACRANGNPLTKLLKLLTGMEAKLNQYAAGERFIAAIEAVAGPSDRRVLDLASDAPFDRRDPRPAAVAAPHRTMRRLSALDRRRHACSQPRIVKHHRRGAGVRGRRTGNPTRSERTKE